MTGNTLHETYISAVQKEFDESTVLLVDDSDIAKNCSVKLEGLCKVHDGSTGGIANGYWFAGVSALTAGRKQPIPVYSRVYSSVEQGYVSNNMETIKSLEFLTSHFSKANIPDMTRDMSLITLYRARKALSFVCAATATSFTTGKRG